MTPLPGSEDHKTLLKKGVWMDPDINKYDLDHRVAHHSKMSDQEWEDAYRAAWATYYTPEHIRTILKRAAQIPNGRPKPITSTIMWFKLMIEQEGVHPLEGGAFRLKYRRDRRRSLPLESPLVFYPRYWGGIAVKAWHYSRFFLRTRRILNEVLNAPDRYTYTDLAIAPPRDDEFEQLSLYHATSGGEAALARKALGDSIRDSGRPAAAACRRRRRRSDLKAMIEAAQVRAARALIGWSQRELADAAGLPLSTVDRFETGASDSVPAEAVAKMRAALELAGVAFIPKNGGGAGVRLSKGSEAKYLGWDDLNAANDE